MYIDVFERQGGLTLFTSPNCLVSLLVCTRSLPLLSLWFIRYLSHMLSTRTSQHPQLSLSCFPFWSWFFNIILPFMVRTLCMDAGRSFPGHSLREKDLTCNLFAAPSAWRISAFCQKHSRSVHVISVWLGIAVGVMATWRLKNNSINLFIMFSVL